MARKLDLGKEKNPAVQRLADMLVKAFDEVGPKIEADLKKAYRENADYWFGKFMEASATETGSVTPSGTFRRQKGGFSGWSEYAELTKKAGEYYKPEIRTWEDVRTNKSRFRVTYTQADERAEESYAGARDSFVYKNLDKMRQVLGTRTDLKNALIKFDWRGNYFKGNLQVYLEGAYFRGDVDIKYVLRTIPRVTPYFQYPLVFVEAEVKGKHYPRPSEDELRILLGATKTAAQEKQEAAALSGICPMSGKPAPPELLKGLYNRMSIYVKCPGCGAIANVNKQSFNFRPHKTPGAEKAGAAAKLETAGYCPKSREKVSPETIAKIGPVAGYSDPKVACEHCGQLTRLDAEKDWIFAGVPEGGHATKMIVKSARYYKHKLLVKENPSEKKAKCRCQHPKYTHAVNGCLGSVKQGAVYRPCPCTAFKPK
jgi:hypothetical protein